MTSGDRRRSTRESITLVVEYEDAGQLLADLTEDLSSGGTMVHTEKDFTPGTSVRLSLSFPGLLSPVSVTGVVRWTRPGEGDERDVGIEFEQSSDALAAIRRLLPRIESGDPKVVGRVVRILVVEDNPHVAQLIRDGLAVGSKKAFSESIAFELDHVTNGRDALARLRERPVDALIVDIYLPVLDGATLIETVRSEEALRELPILAVSAGGASAREAALTAGADVFLDKPMRLRQVLATMQRLLTGGRKGGADSQDEEAMPR